MSDDEETLFETEQQLSVVEVVRRLREAAGAVWRLVPSSWAVTPWPRRQR